MVPICKKKSFAVILGFMSSFYHILSRTTQTQPHPEKPPERRKSPSANLCELDNGHILKRKPPEKARLSLAAGLDEFFRNRRGRPASDKRDTQADILHGRFALQSEDPQRTSGPCSRDSGRGSSRPPRAGAPREC